MKNKLKEMLLKHKPITEETYDIDDIWGETVADGAEDFEEIPEVEDAEEVVEDVPEEEVVEDVPAEETKHTIANAIEEGFWTPLLRLKMDNRNDRIEAKTKKLNKNIDKLEKAKNENKDKVVIDKLKAKADKTAAKLDTHTVEYKRAHDQRYGKLADKILNKPGYAEKMIRDPRKLNKISNPSMFAAQIENKAKANHEIKDRVVQSTTKRRDDDARYIKQLQQAGSIPEYNEKPKVTPKVTPKVMPTTKVDQPNDQTFQTPHQKVASDAAAVKERLSKVRSIM